MMTFTIKTPQPKLLFTRTPVTRTRTTGILAHHYVHPNATPQDVHRWHLERGWIGCGYHFMVDKNGTIWQGRDIKAVGAHAGMPHNNETVAVAFQGNFHPSGNSSLRVDKEMTDEQFNAGVWLFRYIRAIYGEIPIFGHREVASSSCPGQFFPLDELRKLEFRGKNKEEIEMIYRTVKEMPEWARPGIQQLIDMQVLSGRSANNLDINENMMRTLLIVRNMFDRAGLLEKIAGSTVK